MVVSKFLLHGPELLMAARSGDIVLLREVLNGEEDESAVAAAAMVVVEVHHEAGRRLQAADASATSAASSTTHPAAEEEEPKTTTTTATTVALTSQGDSLLHVVAASGEGDNFLACASLIHEKTSRSHLKLQVMSNCNSKGDTPLHCAARAGNMAMLCRLISLAGRTTRAVLRKQNERGETVLHEGIRLGMEGMVDMLVSADQELARVPDLGTSPLYLAISLGCTSIAQLLHRKDAGLSYSGPRGQTALHAAVLQGNVMTKMVLEWNKDLAKVVDIFGDSPLHFAASVERSRMEVVLGSSFWFSFRGSRYGMTKLLLQANKSSAYQPDRDGSFPIHVAASMGRLEVIKVMLAECPDCAGLLDARGRTFLHVAVEKRRNDIVSFACRKPWLASVLNMKDGDMNTALHLAVEAEDLKIFSCLMRNRKVCLHLGNKEGRTPLDVSESMINLSAIHYGSNAQMWIQRLLAATSMEGTSYRRDRFHEIYTPKLQRMEEINKITDSTQFLGISSVLIVTITFAAAFAPPGGYIADDRPNRGAQTLAGTYAFDAFVIANTMAFICSSLATFGLMYSGMSAVDFSIRLKYFTISLILLRSSVRSLGVAFALGIYVALAPVSHATAISVCVITLSLVLFGNRYLYQTTNHAVFLHLRLGFKIWMSLGVTILVNFFFEYWSYLIIFGWPACTRSLNL